MDYRIHFSRTQMASSSLKLCFTPVITISTASSQFLTPLRLNHTFFSNKRRYVAVKAQNSDSQQQELNLSVLRFTLGIEGLDESYLPRYIGIGFGALVVLNHFLTINPTPPQINSEILGVFLAIFSATLPYLGKFLEGVSSVNRLPMPESSKQIFILSENTNTKLKEDIAWASYALLRNTNSISVLIAINDTLCVRGYWSNNNTTEDISKENIITKFKDQIENEGFLELQETLYFPNSTEYQIGKIVPKEVVAVVIVPILGELNSKGFILVGSNSNYAYSEKDIAWIQSVANKFVKTNGI